MKEIGFNFGNVDQIPERMRKVVRWVLWKKENDTKVPYQTNGKRASSTSEATWTTFESALNALKLQDIYAGIGFMLGHGYVGLDIDDCLNNSASDWAMPTLTSLAGSTYYELSPSGTGIKAFGYSPDLELGSFTASNWPASPGSKHGAAGFEFYPGKRFFTVTGEVCKKSVPILGDIGEVVLDVYARHAAKPRPKHQSVVVEGERPGDVFNEKHSWTELLEADGWTSSRETGQSRDWAYPGKPDGYKSAAEWFDGGDFITVFSEHGPIPSGSHTKFSYYTYSKHGGDFQAAAKELTRLGYVANVRREPGSTQVSAQPPGKPILRAFSSITSRAVEWLWEGRIPQGRISLLAGDQGQGKSFLTCDAAARVSTGSPWPDGSPCERGSVLFITAEDDPGDTIKPRLVAHRADVDRVHVLAGFHDPKGDEQFFQLRHLDVLEQAVEVIPDLRLIVIDPIGSFIGGADSYKDAEVRSVLAPLAKMAIDRNVATVIVAHTRKASSPKADDLVLGSRAFTALARSVWHLRVDPEDKSRRLFLPGKNNLAAKASGLAFTITGEPACLHWEDKPLDLSADDAMADEEESEGGTALQEAKVFLEDFLHRGPAPAAKILKSARAAGHSEKTIKRAKQKLGIQSVKGGFGHAGEWVWDFPYEEPKGGQGDNLSKNNGPLSGSSAPLAKTQGDEPISFGPLSTKEEENPKGGQEEKIEGVDPLRSPDCQEVLF